MERIGERKGKGKNGVGRERNGKRKECVGKGREKREKETGID